MADMNEKDLRALAPIVEAETWFQPGSKRDTPRKGITNSRIQKLVDAGLVVAKTATYRH